MHSATTASGCVSCGGGSRHARTRFAPFRANAIAASRPMPLLEPEIMIHFPCTDLRSSSGIDRVDPFAPFLFWDTTQLKGGSLMPRGES